MPKRVIDFDAMWGSDKLASCAAWAQAEYAWLYGLADASGCFELTNLRVIWGRVAAVRHDLPLERLEKIFQEFHEKGLLFVWEENGKRYGHWSGSDVPGRLPPPSWRMRLERLAPPVPKQQYAEYMARFARGRAASPGGSFSDTAQGASENAARDRANAASDIRSRGASLRAHPSHGPYDEIDTHHGPGQRGPGQHGLGLEDLKVADSRGLEGGKAGLEEAPAQDWDWNQKGNEKEVGEGREAEGLNVAGERRTSHCENQPLQSNFFPKDSKANTTSVNASANAPVNTHPSVERSAIQETPPAERQERASAAHSATAASSGAHSANTAADRYESKWRDRARSRELAALAELNVGRGPSDTACAPIRIKNEALARIRAREAAGKT